MIISTFVLHTYQQWFIEYLCAPLHFVISTFGDKMHARKQIPPVVASNSHHFSTVWRVWITWILPHVGLFMESGEFQSVPLELKIVCSWQVIVVWTHLFATKKPWEALQWREHHGKINFPTQQLNAHEPQMGLFSPMLPHVFWLFSCATGFVFGNAKGFIWKKVSRATQMKWTNVFLSKCINQEWQAFILFVVDHFLKTD